MMRLSPAAAWPAVALVAVSALLIALAAGAFEVPAVRLLARARHVTAEERVMLAPVLDRLAGLGVPTGPVLVRRRARD